MDAHDIFRKLSKGVSFKKNSESKKTISEEKIEAAAPQHTLKLEEKVISIENSDEESEVGNKKPQPKKQSSYKRFPVPEYRPPKLNVIDLVDEDSDYEYPGCSEFNVEESDLNIQKILQGEPGQDDRKTKNLEKEQVRHLRKKNKISVKAKNKKNVPKPVETFEDLQREYGIDDKILKNLHSLGYWCPTPIQMQAIPIMLAERQILACAPTGSGKTVAFLLPVIAKLKKPSSDGFRALILCPTRELVKQTYRECLRLVENLGLRVQTISKVSETTDKFGPNFSKKFDILICTPNRLIFLLRKEESPLNLKQLEWLVIDESDKLFEAGVKGFRNQLAEIYRACDSSQLKRAMFSATYMAQLARWCNKNLKNIVYVVIGTRNTVVPNVKQELVYVGKEEYGKLIALRQLIQKGLPVPALIFVQSKERAKELFAELIFDNINVDVIHSDRTQLQRDNVVRAFREGKVWVLICTELMGRGVDFMGVKMVINYDFPESAIAYIHRVGRTGRAGKEGRAITYFTEGDKPKLRSIASVIKESGCPVSEYMLMLNRPTKNLRKMVASHVPERDAIAVTRCVVKYLQMRRRILLKRKVKKPTVIEDDNDGGDK